MRYASGKTKQRRIITPRLQQELETRDLYCEPFVGGGSIAWAVASQSISPLRIVLCDANYSLFSYWHAVFHRPDELIAKTRTYRPSVEDFYAWKQEIVSDTRETERVELGFRKLVLQQISYSRLAEMAGSPMGGRHQRSHYKIDSRWNPERLVNEVQAWSATPHTYDVLHVDCFETLAKHDSPTTLFYFDPPYWSAGKQLYLHSFEQAQHWQFCEMLHKLQTPWALSYDPNPAVQRLVEEHGHDCTPVQQVNSIRGRRTENKTTTELFVTSWTPSANGAGANRSPLRRAA